MYTFEDITNNYLIQKIVNFFLIIIGKITGIYYYLLYLAPANQKPNIFLLTCIDYRFFQDYVVLLDTFGFTNDYDQFILPGSSLAFTDDHNNTPFNFETFQETYYQSLVAAESLHSINRIMVLDHEDCGAYKLQYHGHVTIEEHKRNVKTLLKKVRKFLKERHPDKCFSYEGYYITLDRKVIQLAKF